MRALSHGQMYGGVLYSTNRMKGGHSATQRSSFECESGSNKFLPNKANYVNKLKSWVSVELSTF